MDVQLIKKSYFKSYVHPTFNTHELLSYFVKKCFEGNFIDSLDSVLALPTSSGAIQRVIIDPFSNTGIQNSTITDAISTHNDSSTTSEFNESDYNSINSSSLNNYYYSFSNILEPTVVYTTNFTHCVHVKNVSFGTAIIKGVSLPPSTIVLPNRI